MNDDTTTGAADGGAQIGHRPPRWAPLADAKGLAELLAVALLPGRVTATASVVEED